MKINTALGAILLAGALSAAAGCASTASNKGGFMSEKEVIIPALPEVKITFDGIPDERYWESAAAAAPKLLYRKNGLTTDADTQLKFCTDKDNLYIAVMCSEPAGVFVDTQNEMPWKSDSVEIFIANHRHPAWYRQIVVGASGKKFSQMMHESQWQAKTNVQKNFWSAELIIPLDTLGPLAGGDLRMNILRTRRNVKEIITWQDLKSRALEVESFGAIAIPGAPDVLRHRPWSFRVKSRSAGLGYESAEAEPSTFFYRQKGKDAWETIVKTPEKDPLLHTCIIENLQPDTVYEYYVPGMKEFGAFRTLSEKTEDFSAAFTMDLHCRAVPFAEILKRGDVQKSDLVFLLGDQIAASLAREYHYDGYLNALTANWSKPFYAVMGNHEGRGEAADSFYDLFADGQKAGYDAFCHKGVFFVILDTDRDFEMSEDYKQAQIEFLKKVTATDEFKNAQFRVLLLHVPISFEWRRWGTENYAIFSALPVETQRMFDLALGGHIHEYTRCLVGDKKIFSHEEDVNNLPAVRNLPFPEFIGPELGLILMDKSDDALKLQIFDQQGKVLDRYTVKAKK